MSQIKVRRALLSVSDKSGLVELAQRLHALGIELLSTGGTAATLTAAGLPVIEVSAYTGFPEMMAGRLKTLHPKIHGGLLGRRGQDDAAMAASDIGAIDLLVVNLYPFAETIAKPGVSLAEAIENIDIGGPAMLRSAAKNHASVGVVTSPADYPELLEALENDAFDLALRQRLALKTFQHTASYDRAIANYLERQFAGGDELPDNLSIEFHCRERLRYGENPHQRAAFYVGNRPVGLGSARQLQGKALSYNNIADADSALQTVARFSEPACVIVKHANPCGVAIGENLFSAYDRAHRCDPTSAFGGIIAFNRGVDAEVAAEIVARQFVEVVLAPTFTPEAQAIFNQKVNVRLLEVSASDWPDGRAWQLTGLRSGLLVQEWDNGTVRDGDLQVVSAREPTARELNDLLFSWRVVRAVKSNAIVLARDLATLGIGAGQTSRVFATRIAVLKAQDEGFDLTGTALASDAFFPFRDGVDAAAAVGVKAIIQPGGSVRDQECIDAANEHGLAMIFTGMRHFKH